MIGPGAIILLLVVFACCLAIVMLGAFLKDARRRLWHARAAAERARQDAFYKGSVLDSSHDGLVIQSLDGSILWANSAYCEMMGYPFREIEGRNPLEFCLPEALRLPPEEIAAFRYDDSAEPGNTETGGRTENAGIHLHRNVTRAGREFWNQIAVSFVTAPGGERNAILVCRDVTEQVEREQKLRQTSQELEFAAAHDDLTGVANRSHLIDFVDGLLSEGPGRPFGLIHMDVDRFKQINDSHGHAAGDTLLRHVAATLVEVAGARALVARYGGDEFVLAMPGAGTEAHLADFCQELRRAVSVEFHWQERRIPCSVSVGAARSDPDDRTIDAVLLKADYALYDAKKRGRDRVGVYDASMRATHERALSLGRGLKNEIADGGLTFQYQPILDPRSGTITGFETLVRWRHPTEGLLFPPDFLDLAAEYGLMGELDLAAMIAALDLLAHLEANGHHGLRNGFNASPALLATPDFPDRLIAETAARGLDPHQVVIEVLETVMIDVDGPGGSPLVGALQALHDKGFCVALDDFGTGYAGLSHLAKLPLTAIKIDRSLVMEVLGDPTSRKIASAIGELSRDLDLRLIGEGVECREVAAWLAAIGCTRLQGYWLSKAMDEDRILGFLDAHDPGAFRLGLDPPASTGSGPRISQLHPSATTAMR